jgi:hypothetical protein
VGAEWLTRLHSVGWLCVFAIPVFE